jgi:hypothetical protein
MSQTSLLFWSARFLIIGGILMVSGINLFPGSIHVYDFDNIFYLPSVALIALGTTLILMPFPLLYAFQADKGGFLGFFGFFTAFTGLAVFGFFPLFQSSIFPVLASYNLETAALLTLEETPFTLFFTFYRGGILVLALGFSLLGLSGLRSKAYSSAVPILFISGAISTIAIPIQPYDIQIGISLICLGIILVGNHIFGEAKS